MAITGTLEDREEVRALHARYCLTIDAGRYDEWIDCFTIVRRRIAIRSGAAFSCR
jgi:hypothetical protein